MTVEELLEPSDWLSPLGGPRYQQLMRRIKVAIREEVLAPGTPLPPEREIAAMTGLSRVTVRKAVAPLVQEGLIEQRRGSGSVVARPVSRVEQSLSRLTSFTEDMARRGVATSATWLERGIFLPAPDEIMALGLRAEQSVARLARLRFAGGVPLAIERAALPASALPDPRAVEGSLYEALDATGMRPSRAVQRISAANLEAEDAGLLGVEPGVAGLRISRISYLRGGQPVELTKSVYRGDAYDFVAELKLPEAG